ncbi:hypothetical protein SUDANB105_08186 (plasmid) [Streptomyces sp. enrichment culture]|uniref:hypothetical protein n=1 Tax=Streptomyces sp. enrichment culture TaxID=1795815 RepID=UPI003F563C21
MKVRTVPTAVAAALLVTAAHPAAGASPLATALPARFTVDTPTGDPNGGPGTPTWPRYTAAEDRIQELAPDRVSPTTGFAADHHCAFWSPSLTPRGAVR